MDVPSYAGRHEKLELNDESLNEEYFEVRLSSQAAETSSRIVNGISDEAFLKERDCPSIGRVSSKYAIDCVWCQWLLALESSGCTWFKVQSTKGPSSLRFHANVSRTRLSIKGGNTTHHCPSCRSRHDLSV